MIKSRKGMCTVVGDDNMVWLVLGVCGSLSERERKYTF